ncbi:hypothetical protein JCM5350_005406 [Sporobolomyces pararoseus]
MTASIDRLLRKPDQKKQGKEPVPDSPSRWDLYPSKEDSTPPRSPAQDGFGSREELRRSSYVEPGEGHEQNESAEASARTSYDSQRAFELEDLVPTTSRPVQKRERFNPYLATGRR